MVKRTKINFEDIAVLGGIVIGGYIFYKSGEKLMDLTEVTSKYIVPITKFAATAIGTYVGGGLVSKILLEYPYIGSSKN